MSIEDELDDLFTRPLEEFTAARNALAVRLRKSGHRQEAERVKALDKPTVTAWAVNQLYWRHRSAFQELIAAGERVLAVQAEQLAGKSINIREPLEARREALSVLLRLAATILGEAGHNLTPDKARRLTATLEAISIGNATAETYPVGHLSDDIDPPGFEAFATWMPTVRQTSPTPSPAIPKDVRKTADDRQEKIAAARAALQNAERARDEARARAREADTAVKNAATHLQEAQERFEQARARLSTVTADAERAAKDLNDAEYAVEEASQELQSSTGQSRIV